MKKREQFVKPNTGDSIRARGLKLHISTSATPEIIDFLTKSLADPSLKQAPENAEILKFARQRLVYRLSCSDICHSLICKTFPLSNLSSILRYKKYALAEFRNAEKARLLGIPVPRPYCYYERRQLGLVIGTGLVYEDVGDFRDVLSWARVLPGGYLEASSFAIPALVALYNSGVNHVDARDENILLKGSSADLSFRVIDWQYASFTAPRAEWLLEHLCAYFIRKAPVTLQDKLVENWSCKVARAADFPLPDDQLIARVRHLLVLRPSTRKRLRLIGTQTDNEES